MIIIINLKEHPAVQNIKTVNWICDKIQNILPNHIDNCNILSEDESSDELLEVKETERANQLLKTGIWRYERLRQTTDNHLLIRRKRK